MINNEKFSIETQIDDEEWLAFIQKCPQKDIFQTPHMKIVFEKTKDYDPFCFFARDEKDEIIASLLAYTIREPVPFSYFSRRAIAEGGPLFLENEEGRLAARLLIEEFSKKIKKHAIFAEIRNHRSSEEINSIFQQSKFNFVDHLNIIIDLTKGKEALWNDMHKQRRAGIRRSLRRGVSCKVVKSESDIKVLYDILKETYKYVKVPFADESLFIAIFQELVPKNFAKPFLLQLDDCPIASFVPLMYEGKIIEFYTGGLREYSRYHANELAVWKLLEWGSENNFNVFDFFGAGPPDKNYGVRDFKLRFGGELVNNGRYLRILHPISNKISKYGYKTWKILKKIF
ncbi:MAG: lipid II:glycine glycyltransferase FemX [Promethearchaeota archaeon]